MYILVSGRGENKVTRQTLCLNFHVNDHYTLYWRENESCRSIGHFMQKVAWKACFYEVAFLFEKLGSSVILSLLRLLLLDLWSSSSSLKKTRGRQRYNDRVERPRWVSGRYTVCQETWPGLLLLSLRPQFLLCPTTLMTQEYLWQEHVMPNWDRNLSHMIMKHIDFRVYMLSFRTKCFEVCPPSASTLDSPWSVTAIFAILFCFMLISESEQRWFSRQQRNSKLQESEKDRKLSIRRCQESRL